MAKGSMWSMSAMCGVLLFCCVKVPAVIGGESLASDKESSFTYADVSAFDSGLNFDLASGYIDLNPAFGFADGRYALENYQAIPLGSHEYEMVLHFTRQKSRWLRFSHEERLGLLYDGRRLWFKRNGKLFRYQVPAGAPIVIDRRRPAHVVIDSERPKLLVDIDGLHLTLVFDRSAE